MMSSPMTLRSVRGHPAARSSIHIWIKDADMAITPKDASPTEVTNSNVGTGAGALMSALSSWFGCITCAYLALLCCCLAHIWPSVYLWGSVSSEHKVADAHWGLYQPWVQLSAPLWVPSAQLVLHWTSWLNLGHLGGNLSPPCPCSYPRHHRPLSWHMQTKTEWNLGLGGRLFNMNMGYLDLLVYKVILGTFGAHISKWTVTRKLLAVDQHE